MYRLHVEDPDASDDELVNDARCLIDGEVIIDRALHEGCPFLR